MSQSIKVSVIIPVYNAGKYLAECLDSVIGQTLQDIEIICVDDGSSDNSLAILREYEAKDERVKIIGQQNQGAAMARNAGMAAARGEYLAFLDADDLYYPYALQRAYSCAARSSTDMVVFEAVFFDEEHGRLWTEQVKTEYLAGLRSFSARIIPEFIFQIASCNTWNKLYKRQFVQRTGLQYQKIKTANDLCFVYSSIACANEIAVIKQSLVKHRVLHRGNLQSVKVRTPLDFLDALEQLKQDLQRFDLWEQLRQSYTNCVLYHCVYNWRTLDRQGKRRISAKGREIGNLLELNQHTESYYYNLNDYAIIRGIAGFSERGSCGIMGKIKDLLKYILPPPVNAFNREINSLRQYVSELNSALLKQQKEQQKMIELLAEQQKLLMKSIQRNEDLLNLIKEKVVDPAKRDYFYYEDMFTSKYEKELKLWYKDKTGKNLNLRRPRTYNEKIQWLKLYDSTPLKTRLADKYLVREWVAEKIGEQYLIPLLGVWDSFDEIDFDQLPDRFVLKANHGYHWNYIVEDKSTFDKGDAKSKFDRWLNRNFAFRGLELQYLNIPPKIIAEEYLENGDNDLYDYKVFCFGGRAESINYISGRKQELRQAFFDINWNKLPFTDGFQIDETEIPRPKNLDLLIKLAEKLAEGFAHVRVDFYILNDGSLKFGEMTFTSLSGTCRWDPPEQDYIYGDLIKLPPKSPIPEKI